MKINSGTEAACGNIQAAIDKAYGYPRKGVHVGGGIHVDMPDTWDGTGATPPGWSKHYAPVFSASASDAVLQIEDNVVSDCAASVVLTPGEKTIVANAAVTRTTVADPTNGGSRSPKAEAALAAAKGQ